MRAKVQHRWRVALFLVLSLGAGLPGHHVVAAPLPQSPPPPSSPPPATPCAVAAVAALSKMGSPYSQGGNMPNDPRGPDGTYLPRTGPNSFDCSGLTWWAYQQATITIGSTTFQQYDDGVQLPCTMQDFKRTDCWAVGDLVFLRFSATHQHVSIVVDPQRGLAADCYNHQRGCFLHDITQD